ncbi:MAG: transporter substrate-binding domain-containing protein [Candidatus Krumholzibacteria bacterium]|nr:transporter substrate-binding domain-containing protein [Candidatus Krumholzibacteria bacterium]
MGLAVLCLGLGLLGCGQRIEHADLADPDRPPAISHPIVDRDLKRLQANGVLRVITRYNSSNYFIHRGGQAGFDFELISHFAQAQGLSIEVVVPKPGEEPLSLLNAGHGDVICAGLVADPAVERWVDATRPTNFVHKVVVLPADSPRSDDLESLAGLTLTIPANDEFRDDLLALKTEQRMRFFVTTGQPGADPEELLAMVAQGLTEAVVVDDIIARAAMMHMDNLKTGPTLSASKPTVWYVRENCPDLKDALNKYLHKNFWVDQDGRRRRSQTYGIIFDRYFENPLTVRGFQQAAYRPDKSGSLSIYDDLIRNRAEAAGFDWRLIAAQIYQESRFFAEARSHADARGLMQVLPRFAGAQRDSLFDPSANLTAGLRMMRGTWRSYAYLDSLDRLRFTLAEYHAGHGHVTDARRLTIEMGRNPNQWEGALAITLPRLMERQHFSTTRHGFYGGAKTVNYVEEILNRYRMYMRLVKRYPAGPLAPAPEDLAGDEADLSALPDLAILPDPQ